MSYQDLLDDHPSERSRGGARTPGVAVGIVTNNKDPDGLGRVKLKLPWLSEDHESNWARIAAPMAGKEMGVYFLPEVDDEVLVAFEHGRVDRPVVVGSLWNGKEKPPAQNSDGKNNLRVVKSRSGHTVTLDDTDGAEKITVTDAKQKATITIDSKDGTITLSGEGDLRVEVKGKISLKSDGDLSVECAGLTMDVKQAFAIKGKQDGTVEAQSGLALTCLAGVKVNDGALEVR